MAKSEEDTAGESGELFSSALPSGVVGTPYEDSPGVKQGFAAGGGTPVKQFRAFGKTGKTTTNPHEG